MGIWVLITIGLFFYLLEFFVVEYEGERNKEVC